MTERNTTSARLFGFQLQMAV